MLEERLHAAGDQVSRRFVAGHGQEQEERVELDLRERLAVHLRAQQHADHVVARGAPAFGGQLVRVGEHAEARGHAVLDAFGVLGVVEADQPVAQVEYHPAVFHRDA